MNSKIFIAAIIGSLTLSCVNENSNKIIPENIQEENITQGLSEKERLDKTKRIYSLLPSPVETSILLRDAGVSFDSEMLNKTENAFDYRSSASQAINLGIYGTDLSFASAYGQEQETVMYFAAAKKLSDDLHISGAFTEELMKKVEENINNKDVLMRLISDAYWAANSELKDNERATVSALVLCGAWIEAMYIAIKVIDNDLSKKEIIQKMGEQKYGLNLLMELLNDQKNDRYVQEVYTDFESMFIIFEDLKYSGKTKEITDPVTGEVDKEGLKLLSISKEELSTITNKILEVRNKYISLD